MNPLDDQALYDLIFGMYRAIVILAGESNDARRRRNAMAVRALRAEAMLHNTRIERDYWQRRTENAVVYKMQWRQKRKAVL